MERFEKMTEYCYKQEIPGSSEKQPVTKDPLAEFERQAKEGGRIFDLNGLGIESIAKFPWPETAEEVNLMNNEIKNPNDIALYLVNLPKLKAMWLNGNPVVEACSNFMSISELMSELEICNSKFTN